MPGPQVQQLEMQYRNVAGIRRRVEKFKPYFSPRQGGTVDRTDAPPIDVVPRALMKSDRQASLA